MKVILFIMNGFCFSRNLLLLSENAHSKDDNINLVLMLNSFVTISKSISGSQLFFSFLFLKYVLE